MSEPAVLRTDDLEVKLPVVRGSENELALDISKLRAETGFITLDYGYMNTGSCESAITYIDGDAGILRYRGIPIEQLVEREHPSFLETSYLLIWGELPNREQLDEFRYEIRRHTLVKEDVKRFFDGFPKDAHPMAILSSRGERAVDLLPGQRRPPRPRAGPALDHPAHGEAARRSRPTRTRSRSVSRSSTRTTELDLIENFLTMMFAVPSERYEVSPTVVHALKQLLILHADHEQNCSTSTVRLVGSSDANLWASVAAGINALWGPLHGGANQAVIEMLERDPRRRRRHRPST